MTMKSLALTFALSLPAGGAFAQATDTVEELASEEEVGRVGETLARINCEAPAVEKESDDLFEIDDATCDIGQYDIKLNGEYRIIVMSIDE